MQFPFSIRDDTDFDVTGFGTNAVDFLISVPAYPDFSKKVELTDYVQAAGGEIATTMVGLQRLGLKALYVGRFGGDAAGDFGMKSLIEEGVDIRFSEKIQGASTQIAFIIIDTRNGERTVIWQRDHRLAFTSEDVPMSAAGCSKVLHMSPHDTAACRTLAEAARRSGTIVSLDIDNVFDGLDELLPHIDILITSAEFPSKLFGIRDAKEALTEMHSRYGAGVVGTTLGESGSLLLCEGSFIETSGFAVPGGCKDTTGAGDSFRVGLIYGLLTGETVEESARMANAVAALKCRAVGARTALPNKTELRDLMTGK